jgi:hypothetical protein
VLDDVTQRDRDQRGFKIVGTRMLFFEHPFGFVVVEGHVETSLFGSITRIPATTPHIPREAKT